MADPAGNNNNNSAPWISSSSNQAAWKPRAQWNTRGGAPEDDSWEVRAFAEDAASCSGQWPPRSYSCSFCAREFRTAQALGGHMNVHRRERAYANQLGLMSKPPTSAIRSTVRADSTIPSNTNTSDAHPAPPAPPPALGFCWVYPYTARPTVQENSFVPLPQLPHFPGAIFSGPELSLSLPNVQQNSSSLNSSSISHTSSGSDTSSGSRMLTKKKMLNGHFEEHQFPDLSGMKLIVGDEEPGNSLDLELRLGHSR